MKSPVLTLIKNNKLKQYWKNSWTKQQILKKLFIFLVVGCFVAITCFVLFWTGKSPKTILTGDCNWTHFKATVASDFFHIKDEVLMITAATFALIGILATYIVVCQSITSCVFCSMFFTGLLFNCIQMLCWNMMALDYWNWWLIGNLPDVYEYTGMIGLVCSLGINLILVGSSKTINLITNKNKKRG